MVTIVLLKVAITWAIAFAELRRAFFFLAMLPSLEPRPCVSRSRRSAGPGQTAQDIT
jgi:hypothetical protein